MQIQTMIYPILSSFNPTFRYASCGAEISRPFGTTEPLTGL
ncbi:hypothetical protein Barb4_01690 [Bacteroidales bacterium Barb4]|nr:hypothetical protein Barb4_01690 [Bacteroidales bacterium Barb4]